MSKLNELKKHLRAGQVYRRKELAQWSNAVDRHLKQLVDKGVLTKLSGGLYYCPKKTSFGAAPADEEKLVKAFLKDDRFLITSPNAYNKLGVGTTQLYNETVVYNHKRHGRFKLGNRVFDFRIKPHFPKKATAEFLMVDLVNHVDQLAEDQEMVLNSVSKRVYSLDFRRLQNAVRHYAGEKTKNFFEALLNHDRVAHGI